MLPFLGWYRSGHRYRAFGAGNEARTRDLNLGKVALYQLSYSRMELKIITENQALIFSTVVGIPLLAGDQIDRFRSDSLRKDGGAIRSRTGLDGFAIRCITALLSRRRCPDEKGKPELPFLAAPGLVNRMQCLERETRLELATSTLARLRSTN